MENFFASNVKFLRLENKDSQEQLANKMNKMAETMNGKKENFHHSTIGRWENGKRDPSVGNVLILAEVYNIPINKLIGKDLKLECNISDEKNNFFL